jgi:hypothetical protein
MRLKRRGSGWSDSQRRILETGADYFDELPEVDRLQAWRDCRKELLPSFIAENPGRRPWGWWQYDCPPNQFRTRVDGKRHQFLDPSFDLSRELSFGIPRFFRERDLPDGGVLDIADSFESEAMFLRRSQLLVPQEVKFLNEGMAR